MPAQRSMLFQPTDTRSGAAEVHLSLADRLNQFASRMHDIRDQQVAEQSVFEGQEAGAAGEVTLRNNVTISGRAFNEGLRTAHAAKVQTDITTRLAELEQQYPDDPVGFDANVEAFEEGIIAGAIPDMVPAIRQEFAAQAGRARLRVSGRRIELDIEENKAALAQASDVLTDSAAQAAFDGDADLAIGKREQYVNLIDQAVQARLMTPTEAQVATDAFLDRLDEQFHLGQMDRAYDAGRATQHLLAFEAADVPGMAPEKKEKIYTAMIQHMNRRDSVDAARRAADDAERRERHRRGEVGTMLSLLAGEQVNLRELVATDQIDPAFARLVESRNATPGPAVSNQAVATMVELNLHDFTEEEILAQDDLTVEDRKRLVLLKQDSANDWTTNEFYAEGRRRINAEIGLSTQGVLVNATPDAIREANASLARYFDAMERIHAEGGIRAVEARARDVANSMTFTARITSADERIDKLQGQIDTARADRDPDERTIEALERALTGEYETRKRLIERATEIGVDIPQVPKR